MNFIARFFFIFSKGDAFPYSHNNINHLAFDIICVLLHAALPISSLLLPLPVRRNFNNPMIWPEFRWHSLIFASRHIIATIYWLIVNNVQSERPANKSYDDLVSMDTPSFMIMLVLVHMTLWSASKVSESIGSTENRTTNAMPYDKMVPPGEILRAKKVYTYAQFMATAFVFINNPTMAWIPLCGIQSAPFLMTLVRKGKCAAPTYHCVYAWSLVVPLFVLRRVISSSKNSDDGGITIRIGANLVYVMGAMSFTLRTKFRLRKHFVWLVSPLIAVVLGRCLGERMKLGDILLASPLVAPTIFNGCFGIQNLIIPHIFLRPTKNTPTYVMEYGWFPVAILYVIFKIRYVLSLLENSNNEQVVM